MLFEYLSHHQIDSIYAGYIDSLDTVIPFLSSQQYHYKES